MQSIIRLLAACGVALFFASIALAAQNTIINNLPDSGAVSVSGVVEKVSSSREFTLRDNSGSIDVKLTASESAVLKQGDSVTVSGIIEKPVWGLMGRDISAASVQVNKDLPTALSDAVTKTTGISMDKAEPVQIGKLPDQGMVQITGTVYKISDQKNFTLKDATGTVNVSIESDENVVLANGAEVTVTGFVNKGMLGKKIKATHVILMSSAPANTGNMNANAQ